MLLNRLFLITLAIFKAYAASWIAPGAVWTDTEGNKIDAHGGGIVQRGDTFYWIGQSASKNVSPWLYSSTDLLNWKNLGQQSSIQQLWRPKIAKPNGSFWIYGQVDRNIQALSSAQMVGGYTTHGVAVTVPPKNYTYSDTGMFLDSDVWYILTSADHNTVQINKINSDGSIGEKASQLTGGAYEAPGILKADDVYFLIVSGKTGWRSNPNKMFYSTSIAGPWKGPYDIAPVDEKTYNSQNTFEFTIKGTKKTTYVYMGDSWDSKGGTSSNYIWLPMNVSSSAKTLTLDYHAMWKVDVTTGDVSYPTTKKRYDAKDAVLSGRAAVTSYKNCIEKRSVQITEENQITFKNVTGTGSPQWIAIHYTVNDPEEGEAQISINDDPVAMKISLLNSRAGHHRIVPVELTLQPGDINSITFGATRSSGMSP
ncbi:carbohydrate-binding module family 35 protein [Stipitochalara longipes BDJ]|nr:carbohydrate-binding module family 35 protein [Stipitochalara longipes BDJ]